MSALADTTAPDLRDVAPGAIEGRLELCDGCLDTATVMAFADALAGWGARAVSAVTGELKAEVIAATRAPDVLSGVGILAHGGHTTQEWDVTVARESDGRTLAHFRCTHLLAG